MRGTARARRSEPQAGSRQPPEGSEVPILFAVLALIRPTRAFTDLNHRLIRRGQRAVLRELLWGIK